MTDWDQSRTLARWEADRLLGTGKPVPDPLLRAAGFVKMPWGSIDRNPHGRSLGVLLVHRALRTVGVLLGAALCLGVLAMCAYDLHSETADQDFANWCTSQGGRTVFELETGGFTVTGTGRCFEYGTSRLVTTEDAWKARNH